MARATFAAGCFWGVEATFRQVEGVLSTAVGYTGGTLENPSYRAVCTDTTGHAEAVDVEYDPSKVTYEQLLDIFWENHDPTTLNRQGADVGTQYRSAIFHHSAEQEAVAREVIAEFQSQGLWRSPIVTELVPATRFFPAEAYHRNYFARNPGQGYCRAVVAPKVAKARAKFFDRLKRTPAGN